MREYFLRTARAGFSHWEPGDTALAVSLWGEPAVTHFISATGVFTSEQIAARFQLEQRVLAETGVQYFPFFELATGELIGCCGLHPMEGQADEMELGYHLRSAFWRQGLATEAASAMVRYAFETQNLRALRAGHHPDNAASRRVLQKLGFSYTDDRFYPPTGRNHPWYVLERDAWQGE